MGYGKSSRRFSPWRFTKQASPEGKERWQLVAGLWTFNLHLWDCHICEADKPTFYTCQARPVQMPAKCSLQRDPNLTISIHGEATTWTSPHPFSEMSSSQTNKNQSLSNIPWWSTRVGFVHKVCKLCSFAHTNPLHGQPLGLSPKESYTVWKFISTKTFIGIYLTTLHNQSHCCLCSSKYMPNHAQHCLHHEPSFPPMPA